jgi:hypothetical protein
MRPAVIAQAVSGEDEKERSRLRLMRKRAFPPPERGRVRVGVAGRLLIVEMVRGTTGFYLRR